MRGRMKSSTKRPPKKMVRNVQIGDYILYARCDGKSETDFETPLP